jgi:hypothetical protein
MQPCLRLNFAALSETSIQRMIKTLYFQRFAIVITSSFAMCYAGTCGATDDTHVIFPPLQIFRDLCTDAGWSIHEVSLLAAQRRFALLSSEDIPMPDGSSAHKNIWEAETLVGRLGIVVIEGASRSHGHTFTCSVTAPLESTTFIQSWCNGSFGNPTVTLNKPPNATEVHWTHSFDEGKIDVILLTRVPNENNALLTIMKHMDAPSPKD